MLPCVDLHCVETLKKNPRLCLLSDAPSICPNAAFFLFFLHIYTVAASKYFGKQICVSHISSLQHWALHATSFPALCKPCKSSWAGLGEGGKVTAGERGARGVLNCLWNTWLLSLLSRPASPVSPWVMFGLGRVLFFFFPFIFEWSSFVVVKGGVSVSVCFPGLSISSSLSLSLSPCLSLHPPLSICLSLSHGW